ncbi:MAG: ArsR/SmtB family transcription factor [Candidatus Methanofastidiosia archaeon]
MTEFDEVFHVLSTQDQKTKIIAMELANERGRKVLETIFEGKKSSSEISKELNIGLPTVLFHIERLTEAGLIKVIDKDLSKKFREIKYYGPSKKAILIVPSPNKETKNVLSLSLLSQFDSKIAVVVAFVAAGLSGMLLKLFSRETVVETIKVAGAESADTLDQTYRITGPIIHSFPPIKTVVAVVMTSALAALAIVIIYKKAVKQRSVENIP